MASNPIKDQVAIVGVGSTGFSRDSGGRSRTSLTAEACVQAIRDAGLSKQDINGVCGTAPSATTVSSMLGIPEVTYFGNQPPPIMFSISDAMNAVFAGAAETVLVYHTMYRSPAVSRSAAADPFRRNQGWAGEPAGRAWRFDPENVIGAVGYTAWASRYLAEYGGTRDVLGYVAVNERTGAVDNPLAVMRTPLTMEDYLNARMIRWPLSLLDMDVPVDGADAFVITTAERARDLPNKPVLIHAATAGGLTDKTQEDQIAGLNHHGQHVVVKDLRAKSDIWIPDVDLYFPYDGFSFITLSWFENIGWCKPGEGGAFLADNWDKERNRIMINGRIPVNPHGGGLSEGATQGSGHVREAVMQLRGQAGPRQQQGAKTAILTPGGFFYNAQGLVLRAD
jgi:acetyl-CoA acetyltransferase